MDTTQRWDRSASVEQAVEHLLGQLTLENKIDLVSGKLAIFDDGVIPHLPPGLPILALADGPAGLRLANPTLPDQRATALPAPIALAATWSPELAATYGDLLGAEAAATGHNIFLGPAVDIARAPWGGRTFESFGEDPLLQSRLVVPEIQAIQAHPVLVCVKHYLANNQEFQRSTIDVVVDEQTLQELYLRPFAAAVQHGGAASLMGSYNRIDGVYVCENAEVLTHILRGQLGFRGFVMSDYRATPSTAGAANAGLEWELGPRMWGDLLRQAVDANEVSPATLDEMVRRILRPVLGLGLANQPHTIRPLPVEAHGAQALAIAEQAIVLLKHSDNLLPLQAEALTSIAVIGPDADNVSAAGGGSGYVRPTYAVSVLEGIRRRAGADVRVEYAAGVDPIGAGALLPGLPAIPAAFFAPDAHTAAGGGLQVEYWDNPHFAGAPMATRVEPCAELNFGFFDLFPGLNAASPKLPSKPAGLKGPIAVRWSGMLAAPADGTYEFALTCLGTARLHLDGALLIDTAVTAIPVALPPRQPMGLPPGAPPAAITTATATLPLAGGTSHQVVVEYAADCPGFWVFGEAMLRLGWQAPAGVLSPAIAQAADQARRADVAVVVVRTFESEEMDRPNLRLPNEQDLLIRAVAAANPRTIVVLMNAGPVETHTWEAAVPAILEAWYAGQEQGNAVARVLFGDVNPAGKLPLTFPRSARQVCLDTPAGYPGVDGAVHYAEGRYVGYRGYQRLEIAPQYAFGHGLSYTTFAYANLTVAPAAGDGTQPLQVAFDLENTGARAGTEIAQVYMTSPALAGARQLAGWARVNLAPGARQRVTVALDPQAQEPPFATWDVHTRSWQPVHGDCLVSVGASSNDIRLENRFRL